MVGFRFAHFSEYMPKGQTVFVLQVAKFKTQWHVWRLPLLDFNGKIQLANGTIYARPNMNMSEAIKIKRQIQDCCGIETKMSDLPEVGLVLTVEKSALDMSSYKLLADYTEENSLNLQLEMGRFIISNQGLPSAKSFGVERKF